MALPPFHVGKRLKPEHSPENTLRQKDDMPYFPKCCFCLQEVSFVKLGQGYCQFNCAPKQIIIFWHFEGAPFQAVHVDGCRVFKIWKGMFEVRERVVKTGFLEFPVSSGYFFLGALNVLHNRLNIRQLLGQYLEGAFIETEQRTLHEDFLRQS